MTTATITYIRGTSETIARTYTTILQYTCCTQTDYNSTTTSANVKDKDKPEDRQEAVYKIKCGCDCQATYIGETGGNLSTGLTELKRATKNGDVNNHIADLETKDASNRLGVCDMYYVFYRLLLLLLAGLLP